MSCGSTAQFVSDLPKTPDDRFSRNEAQFMEDEKSHNLTSLLFCLCVLNELLRDKFNTLGFTPSEDSDQYGHRYRLISLCCALIGWLRTLAYLSLVVRKLAFCICKNKDADQLCDDREADQRLCFRYTDSTIPLLANPKFHASRHIL